MGGFPSTPSWTKNTDPVLPTLPQALPGLKPFQAASMEDVPQVQDSCLEDRHPHSPRDTHGGEGAAPGSPVANAAPPRQRRCGLGRQQVLRDTGLAWPLVSWGPGAGCFSSWGFSFCTCAMDRNNTSKDYSREQMRHYMCGTEYRVWYAAVA